MSDPSGDCGTFNEEKSVPFLRTEEYIIRETRTEDSIDLPLATVTATISAKDSRNVSMRLDEDKIIRTRDDTSFKLD